MSYSFFFVNQFDSIQRPEPARFTIVFIICFLKINFMIRKICQSNTRWTSKWNIKYSLSCATFITHCPHRDTAAGRVCLRTLCQIYFKMVTKPLWRNLTFCTSNLAKPTSNKRHNFHLLTTFWSEEPITFVIAYIQFLIAFSF